MVDHKTATVFSSDTLYGAATQRPWRWADGANRPSHVFRQKVAVL